jgi:hypothetical protein
VSAAPSGPYQRLLAIAREQMKAVARGNVQQAALALDERAALLDGAPDPVGADLDALREVLALDAHIASAIRDHLSTLREQARFAQRGRTALAGYRGIRASEPTFLDHTH